MVRTLYSFLTHLDSFPSAIPLEELEAGLSQLQVSMEEVAPYARFGSTTYQRNLLHQGPGYQALVLCWRNGQRSPIHDHRGSACGVRVLQGEATETIFRRADNGMIYPTCSAHLTEGTICVSQDMDIHQVSNLQGKERDLVTLHIYSPPLLEMGTYSLMDSTVILLQEPVYGPFFSDGGGI